MQTNTVVKVVKVEIKFESPECLEYKSKVNKDKPSN